MYIYYGKKCKKCVMDIFAKLQEENLKEIEK